MYHYDALPCGFPLQFMHARFEAIDRRFEEMDRRFDAVDQRFEAIDRRFGEERAKVAGQFELLQQRMDHRFDLLGEGLDIRFRGLERCVSRRERRD